MRKAVKIAALILLIALLADAGAYAYDQHKRNKAYDDMVNAMSVSFDPAFSTIEYGSDFQAEEAALNHSGTLEVLSSIDTLKLGKQTVTYRITDSDEYGKTATQDFSFDVTVEDTSAPEITLLETEIEFTKDMTIDPQLYVGTVADPVDGPLTLSESLDKNTYTIESDVDIESPGEYRILVTAMDEHGLQSTAECKVTVLEKGSSKKLFPYYIRINRKMNTVTIYTTDSEGNPKTPVKAMVCSTGRATPLGSYQTYYKQRWNGLFGDVYGQYATGIVGDILFHSVPYYSINKGDLEYEEYNKLGTSASMGCVRMCVRDVKWVYDFCNVGTTVEFYDDENDAGPLGKPEPITIDLEDERRGWDPTDPDPDNPWNS